jgi:hypothetical protein
MSAFCVQIERSGSNLSPNESAQTIRGSYRGVSTGTGMGDALHLFPVVALLYFWPFEILSKAHENAQRFW